MQAAVPSRTALGVAIRRASHQLYDAPPLILSDPIAVPILGRSYRSRLEEEVSSLSEAYSLSMRAWVLARSRYAEDMLAEAVRRGATQYVVLGAGLDTFAHRNPHSGLKVFEIDHPATQQWKRELLLESGLPEPDGLHYVAVDFERQSLREELQKHGLDFQAPTVFAWLGVVLYLTRDAFRSTIDFIASFPAGSGVVMDYAFPRHMLSPEEQKVRDWLANRVQRLGEPFQLFLSPEEMKSELLAFSDVELLPPEEINTRYFLARSDRLSVLGHSGGFASAWKGKTS